MRVSLLGTPRGRYIKNWPCHPLPTGHGGQHDTKYSSFVQYLPNCVVHCQFLWLARESYRLTCLSQYPPAPRGTPSLRSTILLRFLQVLTDEGVESKSYSSFSSLTCCSLIQESGRIWPAGRFTGMQVAFQVSQVQGYRAVFRSQRSVHRFTVSMFPCFPSD